MKKEPRITYLGETWPPKKQPRNKVGQYHKRSVMPYVSMALVVVFIGFIGKYGAIKAEYVNTRVANAAVLDDGIEPLTQADIDAMKEAVLDEMVACEYKGYSPKTAYPTWDDNKRGTLPAKDKLSYPPMQFKVSTVQRFYKQLYKKDLTNAEAIALAVTAKDARSLAIESWINIKGSINEWSCATDHMKMRVEKIREGIKSLEK